jgi:hypothetical protein
MSGFFRGLSSDIKFKLMNESLIKQRETKSSFKEFRKNKTELIASYGIEG